MQHHLTNDDKKIKKLFDVILNASRVTNMLKTYTLFFTFMTLFCVHILGTLLRLNLFNPKYNLSIARVIEISAFITSIFPLLSIIIMIICSAKTNKAISSIIDCTKKEKKENNEEKKIILAENLKKDFFINDLTKINQYLNLFAAIIFVTMEILAVIQLYKDYGFGNIHNKLNIKITFHSMVDSIALCFVIVGYVISLINELRKSHNANNTLDKETTAKHSKKFFNSNIIAPTIILFCGFLHFAGRLICGFESTGKIGIPFSENGFFSIGFSIRIIATIFVLVTVVVFASYDNTNKLSDYKLNDFSVEFFNVSLLSDIQITAQSQLAMNVIIGQDT